MNRQHQKGLDTNRPGRICLLERLVMWRVIAVKSRASIAEKPSTTDKKTANPTRQTSRSTGKPLAHVRPIGA